MSQFLAISTALLAFALVAAAVAYTFWAYHERFVGFLLLFARTHSSVHRTLAITAFSPSVILLISLLTIYGFSSAVNITHIVTEGLSSLWSIVIVITYLLLFGVAITSILSALGPSPKGANAALVRLLKAGGGIGAICLLSTPTALHLVGQQLGPSILLVYIVPGIITWSVVYFLVTRLVGSFLSRAYALIVSTFGAFFIFRRHFSAHPKRSRETISAASDTRLEAMLRLFLRKLDVRECVCIPARELERRGQWFRLIQTISDPSVLRRAQRTVWCEVEKITHSAIRRACPIYADPRSIGLNSLGHSRVNWSLENLTRLAAFASANRHWQDYPTILIPFFLVHQDRHLLWIRPRELFSDLCRERFQHLMMRLDLQVLLSLLTLAGALERKWMRTSQSELIPFIERLTAEAWNQTPTEAFLTSVQATTGVLLDDSETDCASDPEARAALLRRLVDSIICSSKVVSCLSTLIPRTVSVTETYPEYLRSDGDDAYFKVRSKERPQANPRFEECAVRICETMWRLGQTRSRLEFAVARMSELGDDTLIRAVGLALRGGGADRH